jgi:hypothetical protein
VTGPAPGGQITLARDQAWHLAAVPGTVEDWLLHSGEHVLDDLPAFLRPRSQAAEILEEPGDARVIPGRLLRQDPEER